MPKIKKDSRNRRWCFTLNNPEENGEKKILKLLDQNCSVRYVVFQLEEGEKKTPHFQGYIEMEKAFRLNDMKQLIPKAHFEQCMGTQHSNIKYCTKLPRLKGPWERGIPAKGKLHNAIRMINEKKSFDEIVKENPEVFIKHSRGILEYFNHKQPVRKDPPEVIVLFGPTGAGKSYTARQYKDFYTVPWPVGNRWFWSGYHNQETVILDEFRHQIKYDTLLKFLDRYEFTGEYKGGNFKFNSKRIIITSNISPQDWYPHMDDKEKEPLKRRLQEFSKMWEFEGRAKVINGQLCVKKTPINVKSFCFHDKVEINVTK